MSKNVEKKQFCEILGQDNPPHFAKIGVFPISDFGFFIVSKNHEKKKEKQKIKKQKRKF